MLRMAKKMPDEQTLKDHFVELRNRLTKSALAVVITTAIAFIFHQQILEILMKPAADFTSLPNNKPVYTSLTEFLGIAMKASILVGFFASLPFILWQVVKFSSPGLNSSEKKYLYSLMPVVIVVFILGASFVYFILFPPAVKFLINFGSDIAIPMIRIGNYINLMLTLLFWMGIVFELPVVLFFLSRIGVVKPGFLSKNRRWAIVIAFILGALITPTLDPVNQIFVAAPIIILYELGIILAKIGFKIRTKNRSKSNQVNE